MSTNRKHPPVRSPDRTVLLAQGVVASMSLLMVVATIADHLNITQDVETLSFYGQVIAGIMAFLTVVVISPAAIREMRARDRITTSALEARGQVEQLFKMTEMLQSAEGYEDANAVLRATAATLLPGLGVALYVFNNSRDRLDLSIAWDWPTASGPADMVMPLQCWALKRGKPHMNGGTDMLRCEHHGLGLSALDIPMMARGEVYGLLVLQADSESSEERLVQAEPIAMVIADAMSLALSNIALREKLRTLSLRDSLTGLYNRRYMEDALARYSSLVERNGSCLSAIMIDLDHFKPLNDEHGHALGDAVLREAAAAIAGAIRQSDVACRYGGEELVVLLPDCALDEAVARAEMLRTRIEGLSDVHGVRITASFGVASLPETCAQSENLLVAADAALYKAKAAGRNRVEAADRRQAPATFRLAAAAE